MVSQETSFAAVGWLLPCAYRWSNPPDTQFVSSLAPWAIDFPVAVVRIRVHAVRETFWVIALPNEVFVLLLFTGEDDLLIVAARRSVLVIPAHHVGAAAELEVDLIVDVLVDPVFDSADSKVRLCFNDRTFTTCLK